MAEYIVQRESLTSIADEIRVLSGTEGGMGLDAMATHVGTANDNVATEADLIAQIASALEGKSAGGGSNIETCTIRVEFDGRSNTSSISGSLTKYLFDGTITIVYIDSTGTPYLEPWDNFIQTTGSIASTSTSGYWDITCQCNSLIAIEQKLCNNKSCDGYTYSDEMTLLSYSMYSVVFKTPSQSGEYNFKWHVAAHPTE